MNVPAFKDHNGNPSYSMTALVVGFAIINLKLLLSGISIGEKFKCSDFGGTDYGAALAGLGVIYNWRALQKDQEKESKEEQK